MFESYDAWKLQTPEEYWGYEEDKEQCEEDLEEDLEEDDEYEQNK